MPLMAFLRDRTKQKNQQKKQGEKNGNDTQMQRCIFWTRIPVCDGRIQGKSALGYRELWNLCQTGEEYREIKIWRNRSQGL